MGNELTAFEGMISIRALIDAAKTSFNDRKIIKILYTNERKAKNAKEYAYLCHRAEEQGFEILLSEKEELEKFASGKTHGGVLALAGSRGFPQIETLLPEKNGFYVMMEGVEDPFNFGYALRSLYAAGVDGVILPGLSRTGADGIICRSSAGASERLPIYMAQPENCLSHFKKHGYSVICADLANSVPVYDAVLKKPLLLIVGGEKRGITRAVLDRCDAIVRLDYGRPFDEALSAASILAFEVFRQNRS